MINEPNGDERGCCPIGGASKQKRKARALEQRVAANPRRAALEYGGRVVTGHALNETKKDKRASRPVKCQTADSK